MNVPVLFRFFRSAIVEWIEAPGRSFLRFGCGCACVIRQADGERLWALRCHTHTRPAFALSNVPDLEEA